jgi:hypothetical protein
MQAGLRHDRFLYRSVHPSMILSIQIGIVENERIVVKNINSGYRNES